MTRRATSASPYPEGARPVGTMSEASLENEFGELEISQLERMLRMTPDGSTTSGDPPEPSEAKPTSRSATVAAAAAAASKLGEPAWWTPPSPSPTSESASASASGMMKPFDALLEVDRARVSSVGVQGRHVVLLRQSCARWGVGPWGVGRGTTVAASDRLVGGKRDTAFRAGVTAAAAALEADLGRVGQIVLATSSNAFLNFCSSVKRHPLTRRAMTARL